MRTKLIQLIHIAKHQLRMDDDTYKTTLNQQFKVSSSKELTIAQLFVFVQFLRDKGAKIKAPKKPKLTSIQAKLWAEWKKLEQEGAISNGSSRALDAYTQRQFSRIEPVDGWANLTSEQTAYLLETIKQWRNRIHIEKKGGHLDTNAGDST